jgi:hypothetical protein
MRLNSKLCRSFVSCILIVILCDCKERVEEGFILTNDTNSSTVVSDCFVKIISPSGQLPRDYNKKDIVILFRNSEHKPFLKKEMTLWASEIKPRIDWKEYPKVRVSFYNDHEIGEAAFNLIQQ